MRYSIEIIQSRGVNALAYGNDAELPGEHVRVFTGRDAVEQAQAWLDDCKLEQPMQEVPGRTEYRVPAHVLAQDAKEGGPSLAELRRVVKLTQMLEQAKACREHAAEVQMHWTQILMEAQKLEIELAAALSKALGRQEGSLVGEPGADVSTAQGAAQGFEEAIARTGEVITQMGQAWGKAAAEAMKASGLADLGQRLTVQPAAPVNAVDIRTGVEDTGDMELSSEAKSALINAPGRQGAAVGCGPAEFLELTQRGLITINGGLTRKGLIKRAALVSEAEDVAFG